MLGKPDGARWHTVCFCVEVLKSPAVEPSLHQGNGIKLTELCGLEQNLSPESDFQPSTQAKAAVVMPTD